MPLTNLNNIDLSLAVWLLHDEYDFIPTPNAISATGLLKPTRQIILARRLRKLIQSGEQSELLVDISAFIASRLGHAVHDSVERSWKSGYAQAFRSMDIPEHVIKSIIINPEDDDLTHLKNNGTPYVPVYIEQRSEREIDGYTISGKLDFALDGRLKDIKTTSVYTYLLGRKDKDYALQGSIYRWLNPDKITEDQMDIQFVFTDWKKSDTYRDNYPQCRILSYPVDLLPLQETEDWIRRKLNELSYYLEHEEATLPRCTDEELWRSAGFWKYYTDPSKTDGRATKNFDNLLEANQFKATKGKGVVLHVPGKVKACGYCSGFPICSQKEEYEHD